jgi:hypothetical protein
MILKTLIVLLRFILRQLFASLVRKICVKNLTKCNERRDNVHGGWLCNSVRLKKS